VRFIETENYNGPTEILHPVTTQIHSKYQTNHQ